MEGHSRKAKVLGRWRAEQGSVKKKLLWRWRTERRRRRRREQANGGNGGGGGGGGGGSAPPAAVTDNSAVLALEVPPVVREDEKKQAPAKKEKGRKGKYDDRSAGTRSGEGAPSRRRRLLADKDAREEEKRQTPARKEKEDRGAGTRGGGGGAAPTASLSRSPSAPATSLPQLQPPGPTPRAADEDTDGRPVNGDLWEGGNDKEQLLALAQEHSGDHIIVEKIKILNKRYAHFRRIHEDTSCFYRALLFSYLEHLERLEDRQAEAARLMEHVATSKDCFCDLELDKAYFSEPEFPSVMADFNTLVKSAAKGPISAELPRSCLQAMKLPRIISLLRLLAEFDIRTGGEEYKNFRPKNFNAIQYCLDNVRPMGARGKVLEIRGLTYALDIPLRVEIVDGDLRDETVQVKRIDFFPRWELDKVPDHSVLSYWRSITNPKPEEMGSDGYLLSSDRTPLLTLMFLRNPKRWHILYRKRTNHASVP